MADGRLIAQLGADFARALHSSIPRIEDALQKGERQASFTCTAQFKPNKDGGYTVELMPRERIPLPSVEHRLTLARGQLLLFTEGNGDDEMEPLQTNT